MGLESGVPVQLYIKQSIHHNEINDEWTLGAGLYNNANDELLLRTEDYNENANYFCIKIADIYICNDVDAYEESGINAGPKVYSFVDSEGDRYPADAIESTSQTSYNIQDAQAFLDPAGDDDTEYTLTGTISIDEDYGFSGSMGVYNDETGFAYIATFNSNGPR